MMTTFVAVLLLFPSREISGASLGCSHPTIGFDVISHKISACPGTIESGGVYGASAANLCRAGYDVCESAIYAAQLGLTEEICNDPSIFTDAKQFFATKETSNGAARCYSGQDSEYIPGQNKADDIWGCGNPERISGSYGANCAVDGQVIFGHKIGNRDAGHWKYAGDHTQESIQFSLTDSASGGVLCCRQSPVFEFDANNVDEEEMVMFNTGSGGEDFDVDLGNALAKGYASIEGEGECKELCMNGNAPRDECLRVPFQSDSANTPDLTYELILKQTSYNKNGRGWMMSADDGRYDRSILMYDSRFGGVALGVGGAYDASYADFLPLDEYVHLVAVWEGDEASLYLNGQFVQSTTILYPSASKFGYICLDQNPGHSNHQWNGCFGQIRAYDYALSDEAIETFAMEALERGILCVLEDEPITDEVDGNDGAEGNDGADGSDGSDIPPPDTSCLDTVSGCWSMKDKETCLHGKDGRSNHLNDPCVWCGGERCTTNNANKCEPETWLKARTNQVEPEKYEYARDTCGADTSCLVQKSNCYSIKDRDDCLSGKDGRSNHLNDPCVWCGGARCTTNNWNKCEPETWLKARTNQVDPDQYEYARDTCDDEPFSHLGCYKDTGDRAMDHLKNGIKTIEGCHDLCKENGYSLFGLQYPPSGQCFCSNDKDEAMQFGEATNCQKGRGGSWSLDIYEMDEPDSDSGCLIKRSNCYSIKDRHECLSGKDGRSHHMNDPCVWCGGERCTTNNGNKCEPETWLKARSNQVEPEKYEYARDTCGGSDGSATTNVEFSCQARRGVAAKGVGSISTASCLAGETLVSCGIDGWQHIGGVIGSDDDKCEALAHHNSYSVTAVANCCAFPSDAIDYVETISSENAGTFETATCESDSVLTGCDVYYSSGSFNKLLGSYAGKQVAPPQTSEWLPTDNQCSAGSREGASVTATAHCLELSDEYTMECSTKAQYTTKAGFVGCDEGYQMMSCNTWTTSRSLDDYHLQSNGKCYVQQDNYDNQYANAICCKLEKKLIPAHYVVDGNPGYSVPIQSLVPECKPNHMDSHTQDPGTYKYAGTNIGVTCCNDKGVGSRPECNTGRELTYDEALDLCESKGLRICTMEETAAGVGAGKGCQYDHTMVWTSDPCVYGVDQ